MIDLHLHLDGSLSPKTVIKLAKKDNVILPTYNEKELKKYLTVPTNCESLNDYLKCFELPLSVLQTKNAITTAVCDLLTELNKQGLIYAEIRFAPQLHCNNGLTQDEVIQSALLGIKENLVKTSLKGNKITKANLILCCMRGDDNHQENLETITLAKKYLDKGVCAVDLAGAEALFKTKTFNKEFELAKSLNIPFTIHAGEADGPESIKTAIKFGASRIGHGTHAIEDKELLNYLIEKQIPLEMCPTSNFQTKTLASIKDYPIKKFLDMGIKVTVNTDNMMVSNTTIDKEFKFLEKTFGLTKQEKEILINNSIDSAFITNEEKQNLHNIVEQNFIAQKSEY